MKKSFKRLGFIGSIITIIILILDNQSNNSEPTNNENMIIGQAYVFDGDSIVIDEQKIRLEGIDAPEKDQQCERNGKKWPCGITARDALRKQIGSNNVKCDITNQDRYERKLAHCWLGDRNLNSWMVRNGHALAYRRHFKRYIPEEDQARVEKLGIHSGNYEDPFIYKRRKQN